MYSLIVKCMPNDGSLISVDRGITNKKLTALVDNLNTVFFFFFFLKIYKQISLLSSIFCLGLMADSRIQPPHWGIIIRFLDPVFRDKPLEIFQSLILQKLFFGSKGSKGSKGSFDHQTTLSCLREVSSFERLYVWFL
jgi:hypothetical protein